MLLHVTAAAERGRAPTGESRVANADPRSATAPRAPKISVSGMNFYYGLHRALHNIDLDIQPNEVTALIGPSGCGKSTFLRTLNRMNDIVSGTRVEGRVLIDGDDIYGPGSDVVRLRRR